VTARVNRASTPAFPAVLIVIKEIGADAPAAILIKGCAAITSIFGRLARRTNAGFAELTSMPANSAMLIVTRDVDAGLLADLIAVTTLRRFAAFGLE
jgi:hypothetical protein